MEPKTPPEHDSFLTDFDRLVLEAMKSAPMTHQGPVDLEVPPVAKQKFEKKISFGQSFLHLLSSLDCNKHLLISAPGTEGQSEEVPATEQRVKIALMVKVMQF